MSNPSKGGYAPEKKDVLVAAEGCWLSIYQQLAPELVDAQQAKGSARPCPVHGGKDGFRIFKKTISTSNGGFCQTCGIKPDGLALIMWVRNWDFHTALQEVGSLLGVKDPYGRTAIGRIEPIKVVREAPVVVDKASDDWLREAMRKLWKNSVPLTDPTAEPARLYLRSRGILAWDRKELSRYVRFHPSLTYKDEKGKRSRHPGIVCLLTDPEGQAVTINRHYLTAKGEKAKLPEPKKMFPIPSDRKLPGCAVQTSRPGEILNVCEGLETALSVETAMGFPVWPLVNSYLLECFTPPACTKAVRIWADKDRKEGGQNAAMALKKRLWEMGIKAQIMLPDMPVPDGSKGVDWNDVLLQRGSIGFIGHETYRAQR
ncbi:toprim domain-containing protein [Pseudomonas sp. 2FE]|uniref:DUF7146 domain-containing protein n=1 Tax=Pseudomonas sp. 2FE TaxID=2502190 RepID=UPI0010F82FD1|nr:toprim domain-containing protein [Pseudomonas sp. 2FE]